MTLSVWASAGAVTASISNENTSKGMTLAQVATPLLRETELGMELEARLECCRGRLFRREYIESLLWIASVLIT
jgi:hypothetical protein